MVVGFYNYLCNQCQCEFESRSWQSVQVLDTTLYDKVCQWLAAGCWFSPDTPVSSTNKTDHHDIAEILLKVVLNTITLIITPYIVFKKKYFVPYWNNQKNDRKCGIEICIITLSTLIFLFQSSHKPHILQHAIKMKDYEFVKMLCDAGADVNLRILINEYFWVNIFSKMLILF